MYAIVQRTVTYVFEFYTKTCMYMQILAKNLRVYVTFGQKIAYVREFYPKTYVYREESGKKQAKGQTNLGGCQWMNILLNATQKWVETESKSAHCAPKPQTKTRNIPNGVVNYVTKRKFLWLGGTTVDSMTPEINISQYSRIVIKSNTKGYRIVPYSKQLK